MWEDPSEINIPEVLRLRKLGKCYDMKDYAKYRYKVFTKNGHWLPGEHPSSNNLEEVDMTKVPSNIPLKEMLAETHKELHMMEFKLAKF